MGIFTSFLQWFSSDRRAEGSSTEAIERDLEEALEALRAQLPAIEREVAEALNARNGVRAERNRLRQKIERWEDRAREDLARGDEAKATRALLKGQEVRSSLELAEARVQEADARAQEAQARARSVRAQISETERSVRALLARTSAAKAQARVSAALAEAGPDNHAFEALEALERAARQAEAEAEVEAIGQGGGNEEVERQLARLKRELQKTGGA